MTADEALNVSSICTNVMYGPRGKGAFAAGRRLNMLGGSPGKAIQSDMGSPQTCDGRCTIKEDKT